MAYRAKLRAAGLTACGLYCFVPGELKPLVNALEFHITAIGGVVRSTRLRFW